VSADEMPAAHHENRELKSIILICRKHFHGVLCVRVRLVDRWVFPLVAPSTVTDVLAATGYESFSNYSRTHRTQESPLMLESPRLFRISTNPVSE